MIIFKCNIFSEGPDLVFWPTVGLWLQLYELPVSTSFFVFFSKCDFLSYFSLSSCSTTACWCKIRIFFCNFTTGSSSVTLIEILTRSLQVILKGRVQFTCSCHCITAAVLQNNANFCLQFKQCAIINCWSDPAFTVTGSWFFAHFLSV